MKRLRTQGPERVFSLAALLLVVALAVGACVTPTPAAPVATTAPATGAPAETPTSAEPVASSDVSAGVDAEGNFYRGDPNAAVKLIEFSDFQ